MYYIETSVAVVSDTDLLLKKNYIIYLRYRLLPLCCFYIRLEFKCKIIAI